MTFICDVKIDLNICEPHCVILFFLWTSSIVQVFDYLALDIFLTIIMNYLYKLVKKILRNQIGDVSPLHTYKKK